MFAPTMYPFTSKLILMNLPYRNQSGHRWEKKKAIDGGDAFTFKSILSYKSRGVVVLNSLCVAEGLQDGICLQQLLFQFPLTDKTHHQN